MNRWKLRALMLCKWDHATSSQFTTSGVWENHVNIASMPLNKRNDIISLLVALNWCLTNLHFRGKLSYQYWSLTNTCPDLVKYFHVQERLFNMFRLKWQRSTHVDSNNGSICCVSSTLLKNVSVSCFTSLVRTQVRCANKICKGISLSNIL